MRKFLMSTLATIGLIFMFAGSIGQDPWTMLFGFLCTCPAMVAVGIEGWK